MSTKKTGKDKRDAKFKDIIQGADGNPIYTGDLYRVAMSEKPRLVLILLLVTACVLGSGLIDSANAIGSFLVILPYIAEVSACFVLAWNSASVLTPSEVREYKLEKASRNIAGASTFLVIFAILGGVASTFYLVEHAGDGSVVKGILYIVLKLAAAYCSWCYGRRYKLTEWDKL